MYTWSYALIYMAFPMLALTYNHKHNCWFKFDYKTKLSLGRDF